MQSPGTGGTLELQHGGPREWGGVVGEPLHLLRGERGLGGGLMGCNEGCCLVEVA